MADKKVTQLPELTDPQGEDILLVVDDPAGTPISKKITVDNLYGSSGTPVSLTDANFNVTNGYEVTATTVSFTGDMTVTGTVELVGDTTVTGEFTVVDDHLVIQNPLSTAPSQLNATGYPVGTIAWTLDHLYVVVGSNQIKRIALDSYSL